MSKKNTLLFGASLVTVLGAIVADYATSEAPKPAIAQDESFNPCAAAIPKVPGQRSYDNLADEYSGGTAPTPEPAVRSNAVSGGNPCSAGAL